MNDRNRRALVLGALGASGVFAVLLFVVGAGSVLDALASADPTLVAATVGFGLCWLAVWSLMLRTVLRTLEVEIHAVTAFFVYAGAVFSNNITPFGQAGGEPVAALLISRVSGSRYETGLVAIGSVDAANVVTSLSLVLVGVGYYATVATVGDRLETAVGLAVALVASVALAGGLLWRYRRTVVDRIPAVAAAGIDRLGFGRIDAETLEANLTNRMRKLFENVERVAADRWRLAAVLGLSLSGWLFQVAALTTAFAALGHGVSPAVLLFVVPLANLAGATPLPGGLGGIEAAFVALLVPTTGVAASVVTAAVLVFRGAIYWVPTLLGSVSASVLSARAW